MSRSFAIGDIHGCSMTFRKLLLEEIAIKKEDTIYCVGDYIDRGPDSKGVVDLILELRAKGFTIHTLRGNHEEIMLNSNNSIQLYDNWVANGGMATLNSFGILSIAEMSPPYLDFFRQTQFYIEAENYIFVHAGLNFSIHNPLEDTIAMLWTRDDEVDEQWLNGRTIVHGHTPVSLSYILAQPIAGNVNIDNGCVRRQWPGLGKLVALNIHDKKFIAVDNID